MCMCKFVQGVTYECIMSHVHVSFVFQLVYSEFLREQRMIFNTMAVANSLMELYLRTDDETHVLQAQVALTQGDTSEEGQQLRRRASMSLSSSTQDQPPQYSLTPNPV
eukprot:m.44435 g.44435  ORF g.44435 m.44435 type:complete len:108 (+) comp10608_c0_seq3:577-900(+)